MNRIKVAVVGAGHLGRIHARIAASLPTLELVAIVDPLEGNRREVAEAHGVRACQHYGEILGRVDAAIVATPTGRHHEVGVQLLRHGIHLLVEKPLATSAAECDELIELARNGGLVLQVGHVERFNPAFAHVQGDCSDPKWIETWRTSAFKFRSADIGVVLDLMIHDIDLVLSLVRSPLRQIDAVGVALFDQHEDLANARLTFDSGCVATLTASRASYQAMRKMHVWNERGFTCIDMASRSGTIVRPHDSILNHGFSLSALSVAQVEHLKEHLFEELLPVEHFQAAAYDQITAEQEDFADSISKGHKPRVTGEHGREALVVAERILQSLAIHQWDGHQGGRIGPHVHPASPTLPGPHWHRPAADQPKRWRQAG